MGIMGSINAAIAKKESVENGSQGCQKFVEEVEYEPMTIYIQKPFNCDDAPKYRRENYPFVVDCFDLLDELSFENATNFVTTLSDVICGYDGAVAYIMPDYRIVVTNDWHGGGLASDKVIEMTSDCVKRMFSLAKIDCRVEMGTRPATSPVG